MVEGFDLNALEQAVTDHKAVVRILIARHAGSAPRETGTAMLVWRDGQSGTIGGGALEYEAVAKARAMLSRGGNTQVVKMPLGPALGQCCGGAVTLVLEAFTNNCLPAVPKSTFARPVTHDAPKQPPLSVTRSIAGMRSQHEPGGVVFVDGWLVESLKPAHQPLWLYGAGHVGRAIAGVVSGLPFDITWIDTSTGRYPDDIPAHVTPLIAKNPSDVVRHAPDDAHHLVLTYSHALDLDLCHRILSRDFASLGLIGSATKRARFAKRLRDLGHPDTQIARIICPIGQPRLGKSPKAIAVGVAAELLLADARQSNAKESQA